MHRRPRLRNDDDHHDHLNNHNYYLYPRAMHEPVYGVRTRRLWRILPMPLRLCIRMSPAPAGTIHGTRDRLRSGNV